jgi:ankyrin repeat protein
MSCSLVDAAVGAGATHATLALIEAKADLDKQTKIGNTALILACQNGHEQLPAEWCWDRWHVAAQSQ